MNSSIVKTLRTDISSIDCIFPRLQIHNIAWYVNCWDCRFVSVSLTDVPDVITSSIIIYLSSGVITPSIRLRVPWSFTLSRTIIWGIFSVNDI